MLNPTGRQFLYKFIQVVLDYVITTNNWLVSTAECGRYVVCHSEWSWAGRLPVNLVKPMKVVTSDNIFSEYLYVPFLWIPVRRAVGFGYSFQSSRHRHPVLIATPHHRGRQAQLFAQIPRVQGTRLSWSRSWIELMITRNESKKLNALGYVIWCVEQFVEWLVNRTYLQFETHFISFCRVWGWNDLVSYLFHVFYSLFIYNQKKQINWILGFSNVIPMLPTRFRYLWYSVVQI